MSALSSHYIIVPIASVHNLLLLLYHSHQICCAKTTKLHKVQLLSLISLITVSLLLIWTSLFTLSLMPLSQCGWIIKIAMILFQCAKVSMYGLFLERLFSVFENSSLQFKQQQMLWSRCLFIFYLIMTIWIILVFGDGKLYNNIDIAPCRANYPFWVNTISVLGDFSICTILSVSFARRLILLSMSQMEAAQTTDLINKICDNIYNDPLLEVLSKSTLLTFIALFTTELCLILISIIGFPAIWISIDAMVNSWCIILIYIHHKRLYLFLCGKLESYFTSYCVLCYSCNCCCKIEIRKSASLEMQNRIDSLSATTSVQSVGTPSQKKRN